MNNLMTVDTFINYVEKGGINDLMYDVLGEQRTPDNLEYRNLKASYEQVSRMLAGAKKKNPAVGNVNIASLGNILLEYKLPATSARCDLVLMGDNKRNRPQVVIIELKNFFANDNDLPGSYEGLIVHNGIEERHPSAQVKGYVDYCRYFHSEVQKYKADVEGLVYFTQNINTAPFYEYPNNRLTAAYPCYNANDTDALATKISEIISHPNEKFAACFVDGVYMQNRSIMKQVAANLRKAGDSNARPFVLLDGQIEGHALVLSYLEKSVASREKSVIIVKGGPGTGKSAVAANLWIDATLKYGKGNIVYVSTSSSQSDNWMHIYDEHGKKAGARFSVLKANNFNPGLNSSTNAHYLGLFRKTHPEYIINKGAKGEKLDRKYFKEYTDYLINVEKVNGHNENQHFMSIVDEAHALINPNSDGFNNSLFGGWFFAIGPQVYHIIRESQVSVFFADSEQSYRDNETTSFEDIKKYAKELGVKDENIHEISLDGLQFRCAGSKDYVDWINGLFKGQPLDNVAKWKESLKLEVVDYPSDLDAALEAHIDKGDNSVRILSSYSREWISVKRTEDGKYGILDKMHTAKNVRYDFDLEDREGKRYKKYWNYSTGSKGYEVYVQAPKGTAMHDDPLCEVGCPYVVRGFDWDYIGILWLDDMVYRDGSWCVNMSVAAQETQYKQTVSEAKEELKKKYGRHFNETTMELDGKPYLIPYNSPGMPSCEKLFDKVFKAYRILLSRAMKGVYLYILDKETRVYIKSLIKQK